MEAKKIVGRLVFSMELPTVKTPSGELAFKGSDARRLDNAVAEWLITNGERTPEALAYLRKIAGLSQTQLGELLHHDKFVISRWENGETEFKAETWLAVAMLALGKMERAMSARDVLTVPTREGKKQTVRLAA
jgi:DNA-binding transcriptional regulator YiaG